MRFLPVFLLGLLFPALLSGQSAIIPQPIQVTYGTQYYPISPEAIRASETDKLQNEVGYLREALNALAALPPAQMAQQAKQAKSIELDLFNPDTLLPEGWYSLQVGDQGVRVLATEKKGIFYGIQSLLQLVRVDSTNHLSIQQTSIQGDYPRFAWRGMHLDVCRHFFPVEFIKRYIDLLALHKMNVFHWHLTDDQGWRIEIKQFPKLTSIGGWRNTSMIGHYSENRFDSVRYGGFYTQAEIAEVVQYATERHITVVPEIEMPGHAMAALSAYPEFSCTGGPFTVPGKWGVFDDVFCAKDETFQFLEKILDEVSSLFPSKYIHIGGDECPKTRWKTCKNCQKRIKDEKLKDEHELQSYFIQRIEKYLNAKGKQVIGWDEILEGGLAPNAAVMSWRGTEGGIAAAQLKHPVVMTPGSHCYFDHYQGDARLEPIAIGGFTPLEKVYQFDPIPATLKADEAQYILGAQANVWTEYILNEQHVEYMAMPRMAAMAEVLWTYPAKRDYADFFRRIEILCNLYQKRGYTFSKSYQRPSISTFSRNGQLWMNLKPPVDGMPLQYRVIQSSRSVATPQREGSGELPLSDFLRNQKRVTIEAALNRNNPLDEKVALSLFLSGATGKTVSLKTPPSKHYPGKGSQTLTDGVSGTLPRINSEWLGWSGDDVEITIDLADTLAIFTLSVGMLVDETNWIYAPAGWKISVSNDGLNFRNATINRDSKSTLRKMIFTLNQEPARYVRIELTNPGKIAPGKPGAGEPSWMMLDEIYINE